MPTLEDKILQRAVVMALEPIYEQDFLNCSYGFRPGRSAHQALQALWQQTMDLGGCWLVEVDIRKFFDTLDHAQLRGLLRRRVRDGVLRRLIDKWLNAGVLERGSLSYPEAGTPQGGLISPLLANVYLHWFDKRFHAADGPAHFARAKLVRYADDFVILARYQGPRLRAWVENVLEGWLGLKINRDKTRVVNLNGEDAWLDFLGYRFRYVHDRFGRRRRYLNLEPSPKSQARERETLRQMTGPAMCFKPIGVLVLEINRQLKGWGDYFQLGYPRRAFGRMGWFVRERLIRHLRRRSQRPFGPPEGTSWYGQLTALGLVAL